MSYRSLGRPSVVAFVAALAGLPLVARCSAVGGDPPVGSNEGDGAGSGGNAPVGGGGGKPSLGDASALAFPDALKVPDGGLDVGPCAPNLTGVIRDFTPSHPDFQAFSGMTASTGIVAPELGADAKPVYSATGMFVDPTNGPQVTSKASFDQWYRDVPGVNMRFEYRFEPVQLPSGVARFDSDLFFPIDGKGFGNYSPAPGRDTGHNFHFTTELHTEFVYEGGEVFSFKGDDDLWVFINGRLALDLGGLHGEISGMVSLDESAAQLGLRKGGGYRLELFHAERATGDSHFRMDTTIRFTNCNPIIP